MGSASAELSNDIRGERLRFVEAMKEATAINVQCTSITDLAHQFMICAAHATLDVFGSARRGIQEGAQQRGDDDDAGGRAAAARATGAGATDCGFVFVHCQAARGYRECAFLSCSIIFCFESLKPTTRTNVSRRPV